MSYLKFIKKLSFLLLLSTVQLSAFAQIRLATYNIRGDMEKDRPINAWEQRKLMVPTLIKFHDFDVFGMQEADKGQMADLEKALADYTIVASGKHNGQDASAIFFKTAKFQLLNSGNFYLSPDPKSTKKAWDAKFPRGCTWVQLREVETGLVFFYFCTHMDHVGVEARKNGSLLIIQKIKEIAKDQPAAVCGDFNFTQYDANYNVIKSEGFLSDSYDIAAIRYAPNGTTNGFNITTNSDKRIDHIFLTANFKVLRYGVLTDNFGGKFPSDHFPVMIEVDKK